MTRGRVLSGLAFTAWLLCFSVLARFETWVPFAFAGVFLSGAMLASRTVPATLLWPAPWTLAVGVLAGGLLVFFTHVAFSQLTGLLPGVAGATRELTTLFNRTGSSAAQRAVLISMIASCEEVIFRGPLRRVAGPRGKPPARYVAGREWLQIVMSAAAYALTTLPLASPLLLVCALVLGCVWGALRVASGSLIVAILAHVIWDLGVLLVWPLSGLL